MAGLSGRAKLLLVIVLAAAAAILFCEIKIMESGHKKGKVPIFDAITGAVEEADIIHKPAAEWKKALSPEQYRVTRMKGTEAPFTGKCEVGQGGGVYRCVCCGTDLFAAGTKFDSGTGWPSFWEPVSGLNISQESDTSLGMERVEVACARCGAHLGHVFEDGPPPTDKRYCINAAALKFMKTAAPVNKTETATFAGGCFWGVEAAFRKIPGVLYTRVGYTGGQTPDPSYEDVCSGTTGHAEAIEITYNPSKVSYEKLLDIFWKMHDPTTLNAQGPDVGSQYRSAIFYHGKTQNAAAMASKAKVDSSGMYKSKTVTQVLPASRFYPAEEYHQRYIEKKGGGACHL